MNEKRLYNSKAHKKDASVLMHSFAYTYYFFDCNIKRRTKEIWTQAPSEGKQANPVESFFIIQYCSYHPQWRSGYSAGVSPRADLKVINS